MVTIIRVVAQLDVPDTATVVRSLHAATLNIPPVPIGVVADAGTTATSATTMTIKIEISFFML
jgi:hypothetical protein